MRLRSTDEPWSSDSTQRIEAFSDGVFAIAITLLILEIHIPHLSPSATGNQLRDSLLAHWPSYFAYIFSFVTVGIYWANHHYIFKLYKGTNHTFNLLNIFFLMCISFLPLPTEVLGEYVLDENKRQTAIVFYNFGLFLPAFAWSQIWRYASKNYRLIDHRLTPSFVASLSRQYLTSNLTYAVSIAVASWSGYFALAISIGHTFLYFLPPKKPIYLDSPSSAIPHPPA